MNWGVSKQSRQQMQAERDHPEQREGDHARKKERHSKRSAVSAHEYFYELSLANLQMTMSSTIADMIIPRSDQDTSVPKPAAGVRRCGTIGPSRKRGAEHD